MYILTNTPPCSHYEGGEHSQRGLAIWTYVAGLVGGSIEADDLSFKIARLHDHKGWLYVVLNPRIYQNSGTFTAFADPVLSEDHKQMFRRAWEEVGNEQTTTVKFVSLWSKEWEGVWSTKRFELECPSISE